MIKVWIAAALRTPVAPIGGAFHDIEPIHLASSVIKSLMASAKPPEYLRAEVILGNALYGGGNPARVATLAAGLSVTTPAYTIDTQCCSGLDAILMGASRVASGQADIVIAGGVESYSRAPLRFRKPRHPVEAPEYYSRPPFSPWADRDPDLLDSAADLASEFEISRQSQENYSIESHRKALAAKGKFKEMIEIVGIGSDAFTRNLTTTICTRSPAIAGSSPYDLTAATVAVQADAGAAVLLVSDDALRQIALSSKPACIVGSISRGYDPVRPALASIDATQELLDLYKIAARDITVVELMEAFAVQAQAFVSALGLDMSSVNRSGGALSRGHPIGASGAILAVRLFHELQCEQHGALGLATIAAAGGLGTALLVKIQDI